MSLDPRRSRELSSRDVAGIVTGLLGALHPRTTPEALIEAVEHIHEHREQYLAFFRAVAVQPMELEPLPPIGDGVIE